MKKMAKFSLTALNYFTAWSKKLRVPDLAFYQDMVNAIGDEMTEELQDNIGSGLDYRGEEFAPIKEYTKKIRAQKGFDGDAPPLNRSGRLRESTVARGVMHPLGIQLNSGIYDAYGYRHQLGMEGVDQREYIGISPDWRPGGEKRREAFRYVLASMKRQVKGIRTGGAIDWDSYSDEAIRKISGIFKGSGAPVTGVSKGIKGK